MAASARPNPFFLVKARGGGKYVPGPPICREALYVNNDQVIPFSLSAKEERRICPFRETKFTLLKFASF